MLGRGRGGKFAISSFGGTRSVYLGVLYASLGFWSAGMTRIRVSMDRGAVNS
jgi:hypothetical protein